MTSDHADAELEAATTAALMRCGIWVRVGIARAEEFANQEVDE